MKKGIIYTVVIAGLAGLFAFVLNNNKEKNEEQVRLASATNAFIPVEVYPVQQQELAGNFKSTGNFYADKELDFASEVSGRVESILVKEGDYVQKGQLLARTDDKYLLNELETAKANFTQAKTNKERFDHLIKTGGITQQQYEDASLNFENAKIRLEGVKLRLADTYIKAPISGVVNARYIEQGSFLTPGAKLFNIVDTKNLELRVNVTEGQALQVKEGDKVQVVADALPNQPVSGKVTFIGVKADKSLTYPVEIALNNDNELSFRAGMFGTATFKAGQAVNSIVIPRSAIFGSLQNPQVYVVEGEIASLKPVTIGQTENKFVEITSGLEEGELVVTTGQINLENGTQVSILNQ